MKVIRQVDKLFYFTERTDAGDNIFKEFGRLYYIEMSDTTLDFINKNPLTFKKYQFVDTPTREFLIEKEEYRELKRCNQLNELAPEFLNRMNFLKNKYAFK